MWESQLLQVKSKGQLTEKAGGLAGIAARRALTGSQYFTPAWVSNVIGHCVNQNTQPESYLSVLDNSIGSGRLMMWANNPERFSLHGLDVDADKVTLVGDVFNEAGFKTDFVNAGMEDVSLGEYSLCVMNPPFSITLTSPNLSAYDGITTYGRFGPNTSALSHEYALQQALKHAGVVFAILPQSQVDSLAKYKGANRLAGVFKLPNDAFLQEGVTQVNTSLCIFDSLPRTQVIRGALNEGDALPKLNLTIRTASQLRSPRIQLKGVDENKPLITLPVTGDNSVRLYAKSRDEIGLRFSCGRLQALALNQIYDRRLVSTREHRYPRSVKYAGQGKLWLQAHLVDKNPLDSIHERLVKPLEALGAKVCLDDQLVNRIRNLQKREIRQSTPFGKWIYKETTTGPAIARISSPIDVMDFESPIIHKGESYPVVLGSDNHTVLINGKNIQIERSRAEELFTLPKTNDGGEWIERHRPISSMYRAEAKRLELQAKAMSIDTWASWDFQFEDVIELALKKSGVCGYQMGLGKTRMAFALALMGGKHNVIVVKARLFNEFIKQMDVLTPEQKAQVKILSKPTDIVDLAKVNVTTYSFMKKEVRVPHAKPHKRFQMVASLLKNRIHTLISDEGSILCNRQSAQCQAMWLVNAKKRYLLDGEILTGYARHALPVFQYLSGGDRGRISQPYALHDAFLDGSTRNSMEKAIRGVQAFTERHVTITWSTNQFTEELTEGAKREVPRIKNIEAFRVLADRFIKRRVHGEPDVTKHVTIQVPKINKPTIVDWDFNHLQVFVRTAENYAQWFREHERQRGNEGKNVNLAAVLQQVNSVVNATNRPYDIGKSYKGPLVHELTSKMRAAISQLKAYLQGEHKPILFAHSPSLLLKLANELKKDGLQPVVIHGQVNMDKRTALLDEFQADTSGKMVALLSIGCCNDGLNLPAADRVLFYDRDWEARVEAQAIARVLRPEQVNQVEVDFLHLPGSIDVYQEQIVDWKQTTCRAGLDYGEDYQDEEFYHHEHFISEFIESVPNLREMLRETKLAA